VVVAVPQRRLFAIDGVGAPGAADFRLASATLHDVANTLRREIGSGRAGTTPRVVEVAWWTHPEIAPEETADAFADRSTWHWQQMIEIPARAEIGDAEAAIDATRRAAGRTVPLVRVIELEEGQAAQILHIGGRAGEPESVRKLYAAIAEAGLRPRGHLHQIVLADPAEVPEGRARSILRLPVEPSD
jgi:hypothetical protein